MVQPYSIYTDISDLMLGVSGPAAQWHLHLCHARITPLILSTPSWPPLTQHPGLPCLHLRKVPQAARSYSSDFESTAKRELVHSNIAGLVRISKGKSKYAVTFLDHLLGFLPTKQESENSQSCIRNLA